MADTGLNFSHEFEENNNEEDDDFPIIYSIFSTHNILKLIRRIGNQEDLFKLRQLNNICYEMLNSHYFDLIDQVITILHRTCKIRPQAQTDPKVELDEWTLVAAKKDDYKKLPFLRRREVPLQRLAIYKHIFRTATFTYSKLSSKMLEICEDLYPYITTVSMECSRFPIFDSWAFSKLIDQFTVLKTIQLVIPQRKVMPLEDLEMGLNGLKSSPQVTMFLSNEQDGIVERFGCRANTTLKLAISRPNILSGAFTTEKFQHICTKYQKFPNVQITSIPEIRILNIADLKIFTTLWHLYGTCIEELILNLEIPNSEHFNGQEESDTKECLFSLSSIVTKLILTMEAIGTGPQMSLLNWNCDWPKLTYLLIYNCKQPMGILKHCPQLTSLLMLKLDYELCFYLTTKEQSYVENLAYYFENLPQLKDLYLCFLKKDRAVIENNNLASYLKELLPSNAFFAFGYAPWTNRTY